MMFNNGQRLYVAGGLCAFALLLGCYFYLTSFTSSNRILQEAVESNTLHTQSLKDKLSQVLTNCGQGPRHTPEQRQPSSESSASGQQWQDWLSFLHMDAHALCEDIYKADAGRDYKQRVEGYYEIVRQHNQYLNSLNMSKLFEDFDGHSARYPEETYVMWALVQLPFVKTVCETGFNAGHSAHLWLSANPKVKVYSFDIAGFRAARPMAHYLQQKYPNRLTVTWGDSRQTLPDFIRQRPDVKCDLMIVDGGHEYDIATQDIANFKTMTASNLNIVFMDNYPDRRFGNKHARAWEQFKRRGELLEIFQCHYQNLMQGFVFGRYLLGNN